MAIAYTSEERAVRELLSNALPGVAFEVGVSQNERRLMLQARAPAAAAEAARAELRKPPVGFEVVSA